MYQRFLILIHVVTSPYIVRRPKTVISNEFTHNQSPLSDVSLAHTHTHTDTHTHRDTHTHTEREREREREREQRHSDISTLSQLLRHLLRIYHTFNSSSFMLNAVGFLSYCPEKYND